MVNRQLLNICRTISPIIDKKDLHGTFITSVLIEQMEDLKKNIHILKTKVNLLKLVSTEIEVNGVIFEGHPS